MDISCRYEIKKSHGKGYYWTFAVLVGDRWDEVARQTGYRKEPDDCRGLIEIIRTKSADVPIIGPIEPP